MQARPDPILLPPRQLLGSLFSFEALLLLYMFAGFYKADPRFAWFPVDPTALFFVLSVVVGSFLIVTGPIHKKALPVVFAMVCFVTWLWLSLLWSPSRSYGPDKLFFLGTLALWALIATALIIAPDPERLRRLLTLLVVLSLWVAIEGVLIYVEAGGRTTQIYVAGASYLMIGRVCGLGALVALTAWMSGAGRPMGWLCLALFVGFGFVLAIGGGRGPLLAAALALLIPVGLGLQLTARKILYSRRQLSVLVLFVAAAGAVVAYGAVTEQRLGTLDRFDRLLSGEFRGSEGKRMEHYAHASRLWQEAPVLGHGAGSWPLLTGRSDVPVYPHNLIAEVLVEGGLVGLVLFLVLVGTALRGASFERLRRDPQALCALMLFANAFFNTMVSGDLAGNRTMFMLLGVLALFAVRPASAPGAGLAPRSPFAQVTRSSRTAASSTG